MKQAFAFFVLLFCALNISAKNHSEENMREFKQEFDGLIELDGTTMYVQRVIYFEGVKADSLKKAIESYISQRVERKYNGDASNADKVYSSDDIICTECSPNFYLGKIGWTKAYAKMYYVYRFEIKDYKVRATIFINSYDYLGFHILPTDTYPFCKERNKHLVKSMLEFFRQIVNYCNSTFNKLPTDMIKAQKDKDDDW